MKNQVKNIELNDTKKALRLKSRRLMLTSKKLFELRISSELDVRNDDEVDIYCTLVKASSKLRDYLVKLDNDIYEIPW